MNSLSTPQSIIWFTVHKSASEYIRSEILPKLAQELDMKYIDHEGDYWLRGKSFKDTLINDKKNSHFFNPFGCIYGPFRQFYQEIPSMENYKVVLMLRDPRDALTSLYFSLAYSHYLPERRKAEVENVRNLALKSTIDDYVLEKSYSFFDFYKKYCEQCLGKPNVLFLKYEDMVNDLKNWLNTLINFMQVEVNQNFVNNLVKEANFEVKEDIYAHKRQVKPGDHRRKLKVKTIRLLNENFNQILHQLAYVSGDYYENLELDQLVLHQAREQLARSQALIQQYQAQLQQSSDLVRSD